MRIRARHIIFIVSFLFLGGLCDCYPVSIPIGRYLKQTEWVIYQNKKDKNSKCYRFKYLPCFSNLNKPLVTWSKAFNILFNQKLSVALSTQIKFFANLISIHIIQKRIYFQRLSIDENTISCFWNKTGKKVYNHLLTKKWIFLGRNSNGKEKGVLDGFQIGFLYFLLHQ
jgi:hypothetical protein